MKQILLNPSDKISFKINAKYFALSNPTIYYVRKSIKNSLKNSKFKISALT